MNLSIAIDIGGTNTKIALVDELGYIHARTFISTSDRRDEEDFFKSLFFAISGLLQKLKGSYHLTGIGAGAPSVKEKAGVIEHAANLPFSSCVPFVEIMKNQYGLPVYLVKDSNAAALGEMRFGAARGMSSFVLLTLGTGLGCGIITEKRFLEGQSGHAGEAGHICVQPDGRTCGCGRKGCLETYVSATGIKRTAFSLMADSLEPSSLRTVSFEKMNAKTIYEAAVEGDALARSAFAVTGEILGRALADMAAWFEPEAFILSGGLAMAGEWLVKPTLESMEKHALNFHKKKIKLLLSTLGENDAALLGAASMVWEAKNKFYQLC